jgi:hypothetical protein
VGLQVVYVLLSIIRVFYTNSIAGLHDTEFSKHKRWCFNSNTLINAENHLRDIHFLDQGGDI